MVNAIGSEGPLDWIGWVGSTVEGFVSMIIGIGFVARVALLLWRRDFAGFLRYPEIILWLVSLAVLAGRELWVRARVVRAASEEDGL